MSTTTVRRLAATVTAALASLTLTAVPASAATHHHHHWYRHHGLELTRAQRVCLADHGFGPNQPRQDFHDPAVRARLVQALRECGVIKGTPSEPTTTSSTTSTSTSTTTTTTSPIFEA